MSRKATEHSTSSESIMERDNGYLSLLCNTVIKHSNNKKGIKDYIQKVLNTCLLVMYAIKDSNLNLRWLGMLKLIPEVHSLAQTARKI